MGRTGITVKPLLSALFHRGLSLHTVRCSGGAALECQPWSQCSAQLGHPHSFSTHTFSKRHSMFWWKLKTWETKCLEEADQLVFFTALFVQVWLALSSNFLWFFFSIGGWNDMLILMSVVKAHFCLTVFLSLLPPIHRKYVMAQNGQPLTCQFWGSRASSGVHFFLSRFT